MVWLYSALIYVSPCSYAQKECLGGRCQGARAVGELIWRWGPFPDGFKILGFNEGSLERGGHWRCPCKRSVPFNKTFTRTTIYSELSVSSVRQDRLRHRRHHRCLVFARFLLQRLSSVDAAPSYMMSRRKSPSMICPIGVPLLPRMVRCISVVPVYLGKY